ncbi:MAG: sugar transferase [Phycisphaeraceae bacterium]|nr:sugar transferase [Phycisphaeraceae bacterium]
MPLTISDHQDPTIFGLTPTQLHDRFWAARGVQVVRQGEVSQIVSDAELYLLSDPRTLAIFQLRPILDVLNWMKPDVLFLRLHDTNEHGYREHAVADEQGRFIRFERIYDGGDSRLARVALTQDLDLAKRWQSAKSPSEGWRGLRYTVQRRQRATRSVDAWVYDRSLTVERMKFVDDLIAVWPHPDSTIGRITKTADNAWLDEQAQVADDVQLIGPVWVGAGRLLDVTTPVIGPVAVWDAPDAKPQAEDIHWLSIERTRSFNRVGKISVRELSSLEALTKRFFDIAFALTLLVLTAPIYPLVMLLIYLEDGRPFYFGHMRETVKGKQFPCWKFRSMRKDAEEIKKRLVAENKADGPQFFIENDPRLTRVGHIIRKLNVDELPQFFNVLMGHMSIVGPRPSPFKENQYCPAWREARLSVKPGVTGLWQVKRSRLQGLDFQEWIRYDVQYVQQRNWRLDLWIIIQTVKVTFGALFKFK